MFCPLPWIHIAVRNNGDLRVCCQANQGPDKGLLRKKDGTIYNTSRDNIEEAVNCQKMKDIRKGLLNNEWHPDCIRCKNEEASGIRSRLTYESENWEHYIDEAKVRALTEEDGTIDINSSPPVYFDLRFGNKCNLKCRTCGPTDSSAWYEDHIKLWGGNTYDESDGKMTILENDGRYTVENNVYNWYESDNFWKYIENQIPSIQLVHMVGGEPLMIKEHYKFLELCIKRDYADKIKIEYNTNLTILTDNVIDLWKKFRLVHIGGSIDGVGKVNEYIRFPSKWDKIVKNLEAMSTAGENIVVWTSLTVNMMNMWYLPEYLEWLGSLEFKHLNKRKDNILGATHPLHGPKHSNIKAFPREIKDKIKQHFDNFKFTRFQKESRKVLNKYIKFMYQEDLDSKLFDKFIFTIERLDEVRGQSVKESLPELAKMIEDYKNGK